MSLPPRSTCKKRAEIFSFSGSDISRFQGDAIYLQGVHLDMFSVTRNPVYKRIKEKETGFGLWRDVHQRRSWSDHSLPNTLFDANVAFERVALGGISAESPKRNSFCKVDIHRHYFRVSS